MNEANVYELIKFIRQEDLKKVDEVKELKEFIVSLISSNYKGVQTISIQLGTDNKEAFDKVIALFDAKTYGETTGPTTGGKMRRITVATAKVEIKVGLITQVEN